MEMERVVEFPHEHMDRRPRKRQRLGWDVVPQAPKVSDLFSIPQISLIICYVVSVLLDLIKLDM